MKPLHIVLVTASQLPNGGAGVARTLALARALTATGQRVTMVLALHPVPDPLPEAGLAWFSCSEGHSGSLAWRWNIRRHLGRTLDEASADRATDVVLVANRVPALLRAARRWAHPRRVPVVHELTEDIEITSGPGIKGRLRSWLLRRELASCDGLLAISHTLQAELEASTALPVFRTGPLVALPRDDQVAPIRAEDGVRRIGYAGTLSQAKDGVVDLVHAFAKARLARPGVPLELVLYGDPDDADGATVRVTAEALGLGECIRLPGRLPAGEVADALSNCDVLALARPDSRQARAGFPTKLGEYLATGRPVVVTDTGDVGRHVIDGVNAFVVPPGDTSAFATALGQVLDDPDLARGIGLAGYTLARDGAFSAYRKAPAIAGFLSELAVRDEGGRPMVVQHRAGEAGRGGPATALQRLAATPLAERYHFVPLVQHGATGGFDMRRVRAWARTLRRLQPDLVHVRGLGNEGFHAALAARLAGCPRVLVSIHGSVRDLQRPTHPVRAFVVSRLLEPLTLLLASDVVTVCDAMSQRRFLAPFRPRIRAVVANGVPSIDPAELAAIRPAEREALGIAADAVIAVVVGRLSVEKGHLVLAEALRRRPLPLVVVVVGEGPDRAEIEAAYGRADVPVRYTGHRDDVTPVLAAADMFVLPSLHENLSNALLEAMAAGLPVVASAVGGNIEVVTRGGGLLVPPGDPDALTEALARLVTDPYERCLLGERARATVAAHYTVDQMAMRWDDLYRSLGLKPPAARTVDICPPVPAFHRSEDVGAASAGENSSCR